MRDTDLILWLFETRKGSRKSKTFSKINGTQFYRR